MSVMAVDGKQSLGRIYMNKVRYSTEVHLNRF